MVHLVHQRERNPERITKRQKRGEVENMRWAVQKEGQWERGEKKETKRREAQKQNRQDVL